MVCQDRSAEYMAQIGQGSICSIVVIVGGHLRLNPIEFE